MDASGGATMGQVTPAQGQTMGSSSKPPAVSNRRKVLDRPERGSDAMDRPTTGSDRMWVTGSIYTIFDPHAPWSPLVRSPPYSRSEGGSEERVFSLNKQKEVNAHAWEM